MGEDNMTDHTNQAAENGQANDTPDDIEEDDNDDMDDFGKMFLISHHTEINFNIFTEYSNNFLSCEWRGLHRPL
jgi:hypothetical protein